MMDPAVDPSASASSAASSSSGPDKSSSSSGSSHSSHWNPISTLERQYARPVGRRLTLVLRASGGCHIDGGVEAVLRSRGKGRGPSGAGGVEAAPVASNPFEAASSTPASSAPSSGNSVDLLRFDSALALGESEGAGDAPVADDNPFAAPAADNNPFGADAGFSTTTQPPPQKHSSHGGSAHGSGHHGGGGGGGGKKFFNKLRGAARTATDNISAGVTTMAIKAEGKSARRPDWISAAVYIIVPPLPGHTHNREICLGMTESNESVPGKTTFAVPVVLPPEGQLAPEAVLTFRLSIRSGASLLKSKALQKSFTVGEGRARVCDLFGAVQKAGTGTTGLAVGSVLIPLRGPALDGQLSVPGAAGAAALEILATPDLKYPVLCGPGWTLADPRTDTAYVGCVTGGRLHNFPLDATYVYPLNGPNGGTGAVDDGSVIVATERATESAVVLPLAAAVAKIMGDAASISLRHGSSVLTSLQNNGNGLHVGDDPIRAMETGHAQCQVEVRCLVLQENQLPAGQVQTQGGAGAVRLSLQRPDAVFESSLGGGNLPVVRHPPGAPAPPASAAPALSVPFYPRVCPETDPRLLPGVVQSPGARLPDGTRAFVGSIRIELREQIGGGTDGSYGLGQGRVPNLATAANLASETPSYQHSNSGAVGMPAGGMSGGYVPSASGQRAQQYGPTLEGYLDLDPRLNAQGGAVHVPVHNRETGAQVGYLVASIHATTGGMPSQPGAGAQGIISPARGGLISMAGMDTYAESSGCHPVLDYDADFPAALAGTDPATLDEAGQAALRRRRQVSTLGDFVSKEYLGRHLDRVRSKDLAAFSERATQYSAALAGGQTNINEPCEKRKDPRPIRASSARMDAHLSGIGFNVHVQCLSLWKVSGPQGGQGQGQAAPMATFHNVTHGAPSDHYRGFGGGDSSKSAHNSLEHQQSGAAAGGAPECASAVPTALGQRGGLRRLEATRRDLNRRLDKARSDLIHGVAAQFGELAARQRTLMATGVPQSAIGSARHVSAERNPNVGQLRRQVKDLTENLHALTWDVAVRRGNCFSQAMGIGVTSYLSHVSDASKIGAQSGWADQVLRHGFLLTCEGLLSAAGKELGMIEDASVGIAMLRMVSIALVPDSPIARGGQQPGSSGRIAVPDCTYIRWLDLVPLAQNNGSATRYRLEVGLDPNYHAQRVPASLRTAGAEVRFFPVLYQMGVDIRQWGANAGKNVKKQMATGSSGNQPPVRQTSNVSDAGGNDAIDTVGLDGDDHDDDGVPDDDVLIALNIEAFRKMNSYAHATHPAPGDASAAASATKTWEEANAQQLANPTSFNVGPVHPTLAKLYEHIRSSAGKMEHAVLGEASSIAALLGGGGTVFCKSGKDRTAMQVTYKAARYARRYLASGCTSGDAVEGDDSGGCTMETVLADATLMRIRGTRLPICEKNVGQAKFAFNALQAKFMPEALKPPPSTLAGFLKGGRVFTGGGIES